MGKEEKELKQMEKQAKQDAAYEELKDLADELTEETKIDKEQALAESIRLLGRTNDVDTLSELDREEIPALCAIDITATEFNIDVMTDFSDAFVKYKISQSRKGRKGIEDILRNTLNEKDGFLRGMQEKFRNWV